MQKILKRENGIALFAVLAAGLGILRVIFGVATFPPSVTLALNVASAVLFVGLPTMAMFCGAAHRWKPSTAAIALVLGVATQVGFTLLGNPLKGVGNLAVVYQAIAQTGLLVWCLGLGALVSILIKEKNLILPVAIFLAGFDAFLVLTPFAPTAKIVEKNPEVFQAVASQVPSARKTEAPGKPKQAKVEAIAYVGPADFLFMAVFFALLFRFEMRIRQTLRWLIPVMILYLIVVLTMPVLGMLPALVPIGLTVLMVNRGEFKLTTEEKQATWGVVVIAVALACFGLYQRIKAERAPRPAPSRTDSAQAPATPEAKPAPAKTN